MFTVVSRLTEQKGFDLITYNLPELMRREMQLVILGVGVPRYEEAFRWYASAHRTAWPRASCSTTSSPAAFMPAATCS